MSKIKVKSQDLMLNKRYPEIKPFLKWAGGKRQLLPILRQYLPQQIHTYFEPFVGAGALLLELQPRRAVINDLNAELINCYRMIKYQCPELLEALQNHKNEKDHFYKVRGWDRKAHYTLISPVERAARTIYLNKTCFNGLYRVNNQGQFNAPFGNYRNPNIVNEPVLRYLSAFLNQQDIELLNTDFERAVSQARWGDFVYFDPPYDPVSDTASFTAYQNGGFHRPDQERLKRLIDELSRRGVRVMLSNSSTDFIQSLYKNYRITSASATRRINSIAEKRGKVQELIIMNYDAQGMILPHFRESDGDSLIFVA